MLRFGQSGIVRTWTGFALKASRYSSRTIAHGLYFVACRVPLVARKRAYASNRRTASARSASDRGSRAIMASASAKSPPEPTVGAAAAPGSPFGASPGRTALRSH